MTGAFFEPPKLKMRAAIFESGADISARDNSCYLSHVDTELNQDNARSILKTAYGERPEYRGSAKNLTKACVN